MPFLTAKKRFYGNTYCPIKVLGEGNIMNVANDKKVLIVGAGLAGSDAAYYLAEKGIKVVLLESKK